MKYCSISRCIAAFATALVFAATPGPALADPSAPVFADFNAGVRKPDLASIDRLRFLTTTDFPPFNFTDTTGRLTGFNLDLARALCEELGIVQKCEIQALPWGELENALASGQGEAVIAGWPVNRRLRAMFAFTESYLRLPARFAVRLDGPEFELTRKGLADRRIGVMDNSAHEAMLRAYFPEAKTVTYTRQQWLRGDLAAGRLDTILGDGMELSFWLSGKESAGCCRFAGGPYLSSHFLGEGLAIALPRDRSDLLQGLSFGLQETARNGRMAEIFQRYFPRSFF